MLDEGLLDVVRTPADGSESPVTGCVRAAHHQSCPVGWSPPAAGPCMASSDTMRIVVTGRGGHASEPHRALDPIPVACEIVQALQTMVTRTYRRVRPVDRHRRAIVAGTTNNVIPETAEILGTIRAVSERTRSKVHDGIRRVAEGVAAAHDAGVEVDVTLGYPVTVNGGDFTDFSIDVAREMIGDDKVVRLPNPVMGAEDFSYVIEQVPGTMMFLGGTPLDRSLATAAPNHSNRVYFDEPAMVDGAAIYAAVALRHLGLG
jgi:amidohydrolase